MFRWFVGLRVDNPAWDATTSTENRDRLPAGDDAERFLATVRAQPQVKARLSTEHVSADGTLLEAQASTERFRPEDGPGPPADPGRNGEEDVRGQKRRNDTLASTTDRGPQLHCKGPDKKVTLCFVGRAPIENRNGPIVGAVATRACGHAERLAARHRIEPHAGRARRVTVGADAAIDTEGFVDDLRANDVALHRARNDDGWRSATDGPATRQPGYPVGLRPRERVEEAFGWTETMAGLRSARSPKARETDRPFTSAMAA